MADQGGDQAQLAQRLGALYTGAVADVLDELGFRSQTLPPAIRPRAPGLRLAGRAFAVEGRSRANIAREDSIGGILTMLGAIPSGHVALYQPHDDAAAHLGELSVTSLLARGCSGAVIDGGCRDVGHILQSGFPVFCRYTTPRDAVTRWEALRWGHEVQIGDVEVATGDFVLADHDGVVVVPAPVLVEVLARAEALANTEDRVRDAVREGVTPLEAYERFRVF